MSIIHLYFFKSSNLLVLFNLLHIYISLDSYLNKESQHDVHDALLEDIYIMDIVYSTKNRNLVLP